MYNASINMLNVFVSYPSLLYFPLAAVVLVSVLLLGLTVAYSITQIKTLVNVNRKID